MEKLDFQEIISFLTWAFSSALGVMVLFIAAALYFYYRRRLQTVVAEGSNAADLASRVDLLRKDEKNLKDWIAGQQSELQRLTSERQEQELLRADLQRLERDCAKNEELNRTLRNEVGGLENKKHLFAEKSQQLEQLIDEMKKNIEQLEIKRDETIKLVGKTTLEFEERKRECEQLEVEQKQKSAELDELKKNLREVKNESESIRLEHNSLQQQIATLKEREQEVEIINQRIIALRQDLDDTRSEVAIQQRLEDETARKVKDLLDDLESFNTKKMVTERDIVNLQNDHARVDQQIKEINKVLEGKKTDILTAEQDLASKLIEKTQTDAQLRQLREEADRLKSEETSLKASISTLKVLAKKYNKPLGLDDNEDCDLKYRDLWQPVTFPSLQPAPSVPSEQEMLRSTSEYIKSQNLYFPERVLHAFHTALKVNNISPLVVLAGISGTGKSELPRRYAEGMGIHSVILAVQPRWDSPQDLFGFYNYLEERYKATELARAMVQFEQYNREQWPLPKGWNHARSDRMLLVLLDEMNLARVEYYFSEFLSRLETRRGINLSSSEERAKAEIALEMGSLDENEKPIRLFPGNNVLFSGTMNEDETTQALSDKVLDRSCVLRFGRPKHIAARENVKSIPPANTGLTFKQWSSFLRDNLPAQDKEQVNTWINTLNNAMEQLNRPFGHRVAQAIQQYVANYPSWIPNRVQMAMADQIEQRIMPKLRGIEISDAGQPLKEIQSVINDCDDRALLDAFKQGAQSQQQVFIWRGIDRTEDFY